jgi:hypothetical protein
MTCLIIFINIYASNFVFHVVAWLLGAGNAGKQIYCLKFGMRALSFSFHLLIFFAYLFFSICYFFKL